MAGTGSNPGRKITKTASAGNNRPGLISIKVAAAPEGQEGSTIELSFNNSRLSGQISKAHPSQIVGAAEDRFKRVESYEQNWGRMTLGEIKLEAGKGKLTLKATKIAQDSVMDFRLLLLRRAK